MKVNCFINKKYKKVFESKEVLGATEIKDSDDFVDGMIKTTKADIERIKEAICNGRGKLEEIS